MRSLMAIGLMTLLPGPGDDRPGIPALVRALKGQDEQARRNATERLGRLVGMTSHGETVLDAALKAAVPALAESLRDRDASVRIAVAGAILAIVPDHPSAGTVLVETLADRDASTRLEAIAAVEGLLDQFAMSSKGGWRSPEEVRAALARFGPAASRVAPVLSGATGADDVAVRLAAIRLLGAIGSPAKAAVPALIRALGDRDLDVRRAAAAALPRVGEGSRQVVPALLSALRDEDVRETAMDGLHGWFRFAHEPKTSSMRGPTSRPSSRP